MMDSTPATLLKAAAAGDQDAWAQIVDDYQRLVWSVARGFRLSAADAADVSQTTWLRLVENLDKIRDPDQLAGWLATTTRREALRLIKLAQREVPDGGEAAEDPNSGFFADGGPADGNPEAAVVAEEDRTDLWQAFSSLTDRCRSLLRVVAVTPLESYAAVAEALGMRVGSIGPTRFRCLEQLKRALKSVDSVSGSAGT